MNEDFVSYELAVKLKECGFDEPCRFCYIVDKDTESNIEFTEYASRSKWNSAEIGGSKYPYKHISAPHIYHAQKWLREKKGIIVIAEPDWDSEDYCIADYLTGEWYFSVWKDGDRVHCNFDPNAEEERIWMFDKYEQALSAGISAALELIKKGE